MPMGASVATAVVSTGTARRLGGRGLHRRTRDARHARSPSRRSVGAMLRRFLRHRGRSPSPCPRCLGRPVQHRARRPRWPRRPGRRSSRSRSTASTSRRSTGSAAAGAPTLHRLLDEGAGTLNARTEHEQTVTLPNHTSMVTGRRIDAAEGGHGVTWNDDRPETTVQEAAGHPVDVGLQRGARAPAAPTALYSTKAKFGLFDRSWPRRHRHVPWSGRTSAGWSGPRAPTWPTGRRRSRSCTSRCRTASATSTAGCPTQYLDAVRRTDRQLGDGAARRSRATTTSS